MAEAGILPYVLVLITFTIFGFLLLLMRNSNKHSSYTDIVKKIGTTSPWIPIIGLFLVGYLLITVFMVFGIASKDLTFFETRDGIKDVSNWATIVVSLIIGAVLSISILIYSITRQNKSKKLLDEKKTYGLKKIQLLLTLSKEEFEDDDYDAANETFDKITQTLQIFSESINFKESSEILELVEIGKLFCKYNGDHPVNPNRTFPFTTSIPANKAALFSKFDQVLNLIS